MSKISQIQVRYMQEEDRLLLRLNTSQEEEFRFWLTRRYTGSVWPLIQRALLDSPTIKQQQHPSSKSAIIDFERKDVEKRTNFKAEFKTKAKSYPLGEQPLLLNRASLKPSKQNTHTLSFKGVNDKGIDFVLDQRLLHIIAKVIKDSLVSTGWALDFDTKVTTINTTPNKILH